MRVVAIAGPSGFLRADPTPTWSALARHFGLAEH